MIKRKKRPAEHERILKETAEELELCYTELIRVFEEAKDDGLDYMDALRETVDYAYNNGGEYEI